ncbi:uncharacterized protein [Typha angustifolia]|uniref:uncharacterized protein n=1 Tax=Typha angustifolia TaxID=59011 RepID=UPI003C2C67CD
MAFLLPLLLLLWSVERSDASYGKPPNCNTLECPSYQVIYYQEDLEIRSYKKDMWMSTPPVKSNSYRIASNEGFLSLFSYIQGNNKQGERVEMTAPVLIDAYRSSYIVRFYLPEKYQQSPPASDQVHPEMWPKQTYAAVRRFGGFLDDSNIPVEVAALKKSLQGTPWESAVEKSMMNNPSGYSVAGYNSPFEFVNRANEVMILFDMN